MEVGSEGAGRVAAKAMRAREVGPKQRANSKSELMTQIYVITPTTHRASFYKGCNPLQQPKAGYMHFDLWNHSESVCIVS